MYRSVAVTLSSETKGVNGGTVVVTSTRVQCSVVLRVADLGAGERVPVDSERARVLRQRGRAVRLRGAAGRRGGPAPRHAAGAQGQAGARPQRARAHAARQGGGPGTAPRARHLLRTSMCLR